MPLTLLVEAPLSLREALARLRHWDALVHRRTKDYAAAKVAVYADMDNARAAAAFTEKAAALMQAMEQRHGCETMVAALRKAPRR
ncbi:hypothetical protein BKE38_21805 [Pseudoroseomonas deserti]|uniref:Uncharacterized protein n=1 Tax=Teichococcus deserti TaxID=1817963 RepID=A0A1V2GXP9_9PROT|nr:hypothetical protein [Pseudoroseomonas deserti]ONG48483.1 hypothetical protein BKE38_21805 [Pseudoroseomonas deserti]